MAIGSLLVVKLLIAPRKTSALPLTDYEGEERKS